jgi:hypothetical protein
MLLRSYPYQEGKGARRTHIPPLRDTLVTIPAALWSRSLPVAAPQRLTTIRSLPVAALQGRYTVLKRALENYEWPRAVYRLRLIRGGRLPGFGQSPFAP